MPIKEGQVDYDVIIVGAGIAGICFAHRVQGSNPDLSYCILESRSELGGMWSLFNAGLRSDSDLHTYGFPWKPWTEKESIASGPAILRYMQRVVKEDGIDEHIRLSHKVESLAWSSKEKEWTVKVTKDTGPMTLRSRFVLLGTGYYDYQTPLQTQIPGLSNFAGDVVHPQFWPDSLDYKDKNVVIIGSGATAITLFPAMAKEAKHVTILQRSPSYIMPMPTEDAFESVIRRYLPTTLAAKLVRLKWTIYPTVFRKLCLLFPAAARKLLLKTITAETKDMKHFEADFKPTYNPFEQGICVCPDGDFYQCLRDGTGSIVTGTIENITHDTIKLNSASGPKELHPDIVVTATGLKLRLGGGISISVDNEPYQIKDHYVWKGLMFEDIPNLAFSFGYFDLAWTLGVDTSARLFCRIMAQMKEERGEFVVPRLTDEEKRDMRDVPFMPLKSTYVQRALKDLPKLGDKRQWNGRSSYL